MATLIGSGGNIQEIPPERSAGAGGTVPNLTGGAQEPTAQGSAWRAKLRAVQKRRPNGRHSGMASFGHAVFDEDEDTGRRKPRPWVAVAAAGTVAMLGLGAIAMLVVAPTPAESEPPVKIVRTKTVVVTAEPVTASADAVGEPDADNRSTAAPKAADIAATAQAAADPVDDAADPLAADDPRWGGKKPAATATATAGSGASSEVLSAFAQPGTEPAAEAPAIMSSEQDAPAADEQPDGVETAAIEPEAQKPASRGKEREKEAFDIDETKAVPIEDTFDLAKPSRSVRVNADVRMRSKASNGSKVIGVVPDNAEVGVVSCSSWCEITYNGKRGFIYKRYVGQGAVAASNAAKAANAVPAKPAADTQAAPTTNAVSVTPR